MLEVVTAWTGPQGSFLRNIMYFDGGTTTALSDARTAVASLWDGATGVISDQYTWSVETTARVLAPSTGTLLDVVSDPDPATGAGDQDQEPVPDASQVLFRWRTGLVVQGRFLQGRTYVPGLASGSLTNGNITPAVVTALSGVVSDFLTAAGGAFGVWHRPQGGSGGTWSPAASAAVWPELAVQRRRRA